MRITPNTNDENGEVSVLIYKDEAIVTYREFCGNNTRVIECPKVWRQYGKQYKIVELYYYMNYDRKVRPILRVPRDVKCNVRNLSWYPDVQEY